MKLTTALLLASMTCTYAGGLPLVEFIDTAHTSKDLENAVLNTPDGRHVPVHLRTFGSEQVDRARVFGEFVKSQPDPEKAIWRKATELYPGEKFFQKAFVQFARNP